MLEEKSRRVEWLGIILLLLVVAGSVAWRAVNLDAFSLSNDEGTHLMWAWLMSSGHPLYSQTVAVQAPLFISLLAGAFELAGVSLVAGRTVALAFLALTLLGLGWIGWLLRDEERYHPGWVGGLVAALVFSVAPLAFWLSRLAMGEIPSVALVTLSVALALVFRRRGGWWWLAMSGMAFGLSLLIKTLNPLAFLPVLWLVGARALDRGDDKRSVNWLRPLLNVLLWGAAAVLPILVAALVFDPAAMYNQLITFRFDLRAAFPWRVSDNLSQLLNFTRQYWGLVGMALAGILLLIRSRRWEVLGTLLAWLGGAKLVLLTHSPLFPHHTITMLPPLALLGGLAVAETWALLRERRWVWAGLGLAGVAVFLLTLPAALRADQTTLSARFGREAEAIQFVKEVTRPGDLMISDNILLAFMAQRQTPPPLGDVAQVAIDSGRQTSAQLIRISEEYPVELVADWALRLPYLAEYMKWVEDHYLVRREWDDHHVIYFGRKVEAGDIPNSRTTSFEDGVQLLGFDSRPPADPKYGLDGQLQVTLFWTASSPPSRDYTVFVHVYDGEAQLAASHDGQPLYGYMPSSGWVEGEIIPDRHDMPLPADLASGMYTLVVGLYDPDSGQRLPVRDGAGAAVDSVELQQLKLP